MVQKYGALVTSAADASADDSERGALLAADAAPQLKEGHATIVSSVSNLANTIMGSGMCVSPVYVLSELTDELCRHAHLSFGEVSYNRLMPYAQLK